ncbi:MAG: type II toxin-antitoxin system HicB family antitoxin [Candidatus Eremiobacteraeota bacterium]|nr:type II toxin-antitoxin system HicB family antitoxin [Candidatus Eremiobacteraeota bacterium]
MIYKVTLEPAEEGGYTVTCPALPGCISEGDTKIEALTNIKEAIILYLRAIDRENRILVKMGQIEIAEVAI